MELSIKFVGGGYGYVGGQNYNFESLANRRGGLKRQGAWF